MNKLRNNNSSKENYPDYLFNIMKGDKQRKDEAIYKEYQSALRRFNNQLKSLLKRITPKINRHFIYSRHSWATNRNFQGISIEMISESLGHKSIRTTQTYLKGFRLKERTEANKLNCSYIESYKASNY